jgi:hypothetical protein
MDFRYFLNNETNRYTSISTWKLPYSSLHQYLRQVINYNALYKAEFVKSYKVTTEQNNIVTEFHLTLYSSKNDQNILMQVHFHMSIDMTEVNR